MSQIPAPHDPASTLILTEHEALHALARAGWTLRPLPRLSALATDALNHLLVEEAEAGSQRWVWSAPHGPEEGAPAHGVHPHRGAALEAALAALHNGRYERVQVLTR